MRHCVPRIRPIRQKYVAHNGRPAGPSVAFSRAAGSLPACFFVSLFKIPTGAGNWPAGWVRYLGKKQNPPVAPSQQIPCLLSLVWPPCRCSPCSTVPKLVDVDVGRRRIVSFVLRDASRSASASDITRSGPLQHLRRACCRKIKRRAGEVA